VTGGSRNNIYVYVCMYVYIYVYVYTSVSLIKNFLKENTGDQWHTILIVKDTSLRPRSLRMCEKRDPSGTTALYLGYALPCHSRPSSPAHAVNERHGSLWHPSPRATGDGATTCPAEARCSPRHGGPSQRPQPFRTHFTIMAGVAERHFRPPAGPSPQPPSPR